MAENGGFWNSAFWQSWMGKVAAVFAAAAVLPQDRVLDAAGNALNRAGEALRDGAGYALHGADVAQQALRRGARKLLWWGAVPQLIAFAMAVVGVMLHNKWIVFGGGVVSAIAFILFYIAVRAAVKIVMVGVAGGTVALGGTAGDILSKVGLTLTGGAIKAMAVGAGVEIRELESLPKALLALTAIPTGLFFLGHLPYWSVLGVLALIAALGAIIAGLISAKTSDETHDTWRLIRRITFLVAVWDVIAVFWMVGFPHTYNTFGPGHIFQWLEDPAYRASHNFVNAGWVGTIAIVGLVAGLLWIIAGRIGGEVGKRMTYGVKVAATVIILFVLIFRGPFTDAAKAKYKQYTGGKADTTSAKKAAPSKQANLPRFADDDDFGAVNLPAPDVPYVPKKSSANSAPKVETPHVEVGRPVKHTPKQGDGYDEATALLDSVGL